MACRFEVTLSGERASAVPQAVDALGEAERIESALTVFRSSAVTRLNSNAADGPVVVDDELFALIERCRMLHEQTEGAFDITTTTLSRAWGFLDRRPLRPAAPALDAARAAVGLERVALDATERSVSFLAPGMALNFGAIGKGYAVARIAAQLASRGTDDALVSAGGSSVAAIGPRRWPVHIVSRAAGRVVARVRLKDAALGTSGAGEQFIDIDGIRHGHVIDPRTAWPARGVLSASVIADDAADADALATACFVGGEAIARACTAHPRRLVVLVPEAGPALVIGHHPSVAVEAL
jgi:thiamine biosynthesis lipoprotein